MCFPKIKLSIARIDLPFQGGIEYAIYMPKALPLG
jgi:hypothetical protein